MRICHVITRLIVGGAQENTLLTCEELQRRGHDVLLLSGPDAGPEGSLWERARHSGCRVVEIPALHRAVRPSRDWRAWRQLRRAYSDFQPDIIHTHSSKAGILGRRAARACPRAGVVHTIHGMSFNRTQPPAVRQLYRALEKIAARRTHRLVAVAQAMVRQALAAGLAPPEKFVTIYSGMRVDWFTPDSARRAAARRELGAGDDDVVVASVARMFSNKGYEQLIPALADAARSCPALRFVWIGDGPSREDFVQRMRRLGLHERLHLTGLLAPEQVADCLQGVDLVAHCSQWEGLPRAVVQALLLAKPVVCFDNDGAPEVVLEGRTGRLVPFNDVAALTRAIADLAADPAARQRLGQAGRELCLPMFDYCTMVDRLERLYVEVAAEVSGAGPLLS
jgi:glycosyltransferase involved in cell wall biosynthesis